MKKINRILYSVLFVQEHWLDLKSSLYHCFIADFSDSYLLLKNTLIA